MAVREFVIYTGSQIANELVRDYVEPALPTFGFAGLVKTVIGAAGLYLSSRYLTGDIKLAGTIVSAGLAARGILELVRGFTAPAGIRVAAAPIKVTPSVPSPAAPAFY